MSTALAPLWEIEAELQELLDCVAVCDEEHQPELQAKIAAYVSMEVAKVDHVAHILASLEYEEKAAGDEMARLADRKKHAKAARERLEAYVCRVIAAKGVKQLAGKTNTLSVRPSDAVVITDETEVPFNFFYQKVSLPWYLWHRALRVLETNQAELFREIADISCETTIDKAAIKKALKAGDTVPGADLEFRSNLVRR